MNALVGRETSINRQTLRGALVVTGTLALMTSVASQGEKRVSTFQPFVQGDVFVAATIMDHPADDHMGTGRIFQYDADLNLKGELYTNPSSI